jgi:hypothetical protein
MVRSWRIFLGVAIAIATIGANGSKTRDEHNYATVDFSLKTCPLAVSHPFSHGTFTYQVFDDGPQIVKSMPWDSRATRPLHFSLRLPAGLYTYAINGRSADNSIGCQAWYYFAVLPGDTKYINDKMYDCCADPIPALFIMGTAPTTMRISVLRFEGAPNCGDPVPAFVSIKTEQDDVGYYAADYSLSGRPEGQNVTFGIEMQNASGQKRTVRLIGDYPKTHIQGPPSLVRLDLTTRIISNLFQQAAGTVACPRV